MSQGGMGYSGTGGGPWLRLGDVTYVWAWTGGTEIDPECGPVPAERWVPIVAKDMTALPHVARALDELWQDYEEFARADAAMGDPNP